MNSSEFDAENPTPEQVFVARHYLWSCLVLAGWDEPRAAVIEDLPDREVIGRTLRLWPEGWAHFCTTYATDIASATEDMAAQERARIFTLRNGSDLTWDLEPRQMRRLFEHATAAEELEPYYREVRTQVLHLIFHAPRPPVSGSELLQVCTPEGLGRLWGGDYEVTKPWNGTPGIDHAIAASLEGKNPVLPVLRAEMSNLIRTWTAELHTVRDAAAQAGIPDRFGALRANLIARIAAGRARVGHLAPLEGAEPG